MPVISGRKICRQFRARKYAGDFKSKKCWQCQIGKRCRQIRAGKKCPCFRAGIKTGNCRRTYRSVHNNPPTSPLGAYGYLPKVCTITVDKDSPILFLQHLMPPTEHGCQHGICIPCQSKSRGSKDIATNIQTYSALVKRYGETSQHVCTMELRLGMILPLE